METKLLQQNATGRYPEPAEWGNTFISFFFTKYFISSCHLRLSFPVGLFPAGFEITDVYAIYLPLFSAT